MSSPPPPGGTRARAQRQGGQRQGGVTSSPAKPGRSTGESAGGSAGRSAGGSGRAPGRSDGAATTGAPGAEATAGDGGGGGGAGAGTTTDRALGPDELAALEEQRAFLLTSLRDLEAEHEAGDVDDHDYSQLEDDYTARAAAVIRAIDGHHRMVAAQRRPVSWGRRLLTIAAVVLVALLAGVLVARSAGQRDAADTITGGVRQSTRDQLLAARQQFGDGDLDAAIATYGDVLADDPANLEALTYRGWMYRLKATTETSSDPVPSLKASIADLKAALAVDPTDGSALTFLAVLYGDLGRPADAIATLDQVPPGATPSFMASTVEQFRQEMETMLADQSGQSGQSGASGQSGQASTTTTAAP